MSSVWILFTHTAHTHTHTHPFNGPFSGTTQVSRYQKGKTNLDHTEARHSEWQWHQLGHMQVCTSLRTDNHASTPPLSFFYRPDALPAAQPTASKHWRHMLTQRGTLKLQDWTLTDEFAGVDIAGLDNDGRMCRQLTELKLQNFIPWEDFHSVSLSDTYALRFLFYVVINLLFSDFCNL